MSKLTYLPAILIALVGVGVQASGFKGFDRSEKLDTPAYVKNDISTNKNHVNEMAVIMYRLGGSDKPKRDPFAVGMQAVGAVSSVIKGEDLSKGMDSMKGVNPLDFANSVSSDPKIAKFHNDLALALKNKGQQVAPVEQFNQYDLLHR